MSLSIENKPQQLEAEQNLISNKNRFRINFKPGKIVVYAIIGVFLIIFLFPLLYLFNVSLMSETSFADNPTAITTSLNLGNYINAWIKGNFGQYLINTVLYAGGATILHVFFSLLVAFPIARNYIKGSRVLYLFFMASLFLPNALIPQFQLMLALHLYNTQLGYILLNAGVGLGPFLIVGYLKSIPRELDEAAVMDGCGYFRLIFTIIAPLSKPVIVTVALLHSIGVWNDIIGPTIYLTNPKYYPVSLGLFAFQSEFNTDWTTLAAATVIVAAPLIVLFIVFQSYFVEGVTAGAVKA